MAVTAVRRTGRPRRLSEAQLLDAAIALIDAVGIDGLTMEQLAASLGVGTSTVYGYVPTKQALLDRVLDHVVSTLELKAFDQSDWRIAAETFAVHFRELLVAHPNLTRRWTTREVMTPRAVENGGRLIQAMADAGMTIEAATAAYFTLTNFTIGQILWELPRLHGRQPRQYSRQLRAAATAGGWPNELVLGVSAYVASKSGEEHFRQGLRFVIAGIEATLLNPV